MIPFGSLLRAEWRRSLDTPAARWILVTALAVTLGSMAFAATLPGAGDASATTYLAATSFGLGLLLPIVPLLAVASEWTHRTATVTFTMEPRRLRVLAAKLVTGLAATVGAAAVGAAMALGAGLLAGTGLSDVDGNRVVGHVLSVLVGAVMGTAYGALLQNTPGAIVAMIAPSLAMGLIGDAGLLGPARAWLDHSDGLHTILNGGWEGRVGPIATALTLWVGLPLLVGAWRWTRRPVT